MSQSSASSKPFDKNARTRVDLILPAALSNVVLPSSCVDGFAAEITLLEAALVGVALAVASWLAALGDRRRVAHAVWAGLAAAGLSLAVKRRTRLAALAKAGIPAVVPKVVAVGAPAGPAKGNKGGAGLRVVSFEAQPPLSPSGACDGGGAGDEYFDEGDQGGNFELDEASTHNGVQSNIQRSLPVPLGCARIEEARVVPSSDHAEYRIVVCIDDLLPPPPGVGRDGAVVVVQDGAAVPRSANISLNPTDGRWEVWRRFSDFVRLLNSLKAKGCLEAKSAPAGWAMPSLPSRTIRRKLDPASLEARRHALEKFLQLLLCHPYVRRDTTLRQFLRFSNVAREAGRDPARAPGAAQSPQHVTQQARRAGSLLPTAEDGHDPMLAFDPLAAPPFKATARYRPPGAAGPEATAAAAATASATAAGAAATVDSVEKPGTATARDAAKGGGGGAAAAVAAAAAAEADPEAVGARVDAAVAELCKARRQMGLDGMWCDVSGSHEFTVRGAFYMDDKVKAKPGPAVCPMVACVIYRCRPDKVDGERLDHVAAKGACKELIDEIGRLTAPHRQPNEPCLWLVNLQIPGNPVVNVVQVFALPTLYAARAALRGDATGAAKFLAMWRRYYEDLPVRDGRAEHPSTNPADPACLPPEEGTCAAQHFRNQRFKMVPRVVDAPWVVKTAVPQKPALLGQKLAQRYWRGECYVETDVHIGSSVVANNITGIGRGSCQKLVLELGYVLEGRAEEELPERLIGAARWSHLNVDNCEAIDGSGGVRKM